MEEGAKLLTELPLNPSPLSNRILGFPQLGRLCLMMTYVWVWIHQGQGAPSRLWDVMMAT